MRRLLGLMTVVGGLAAGILPVQARMVTRTLETVVDGTHLQSVLVYDDAVKTARPGLVMYPDWFGLNRNQIALAESIAGKDYVILVADLYGRDVRPQRPDEAQAVIGPLYTHRDVLKQRANAVFALLKSKDVGAIVDARRLGGFGFCFGGAAVLDLARTNRDVRGVVSFHGTLSTSQPATSISARVLALNGADDTFVTDQDIAGFAKEMRASGADWQFVNYGGAVHCFAIPTAKGDMPGCQYDARAAKRGVSAMRAFFDETFAAR